MRVLFITLFVVFSDQLTKILVKGFNFPFLGLHHKGMELYSTIEVIDDFLRITFVENPGMAFGFDFGGKWLFFIIRFLLAIGILYYIFTKRNEKLLLRVPLAMILGGAIGNLIDRVFYGVIYNEAPLFEGKVVDFINLKFFKIDFLGFYSTRWPFFNVSDIAITIGVLLLIIFHKKNYEGVNKNYEPVLHIPPPQLQRSND